MRHRTGFTLIEMLVAMSVVCVALAGAMAAFSKVGDSSRNVACMGNLSQIGKATQTYNDDFGGSFPELFFDISPGDSGNINVMFKQKKATTGGWDYYHEGIRVCPENEEPTAVPVKLADGSVGYDQISYSYNIELLAKKVKGWQIDTYQRPETLAIFWDGYIDIDGQKGDGKDGHYVSAYDFASRTFDPRHYGSESANVLYADGHVVDGRATLEADEINLGRGR